VDARQVGLPLPSQEQAQRIAAKAADIERKRDSMALGKRLADRILKHLVPEVADQRYCNHVNYS
jgi:hypothetical protein